MNERKTQMKFKKRFLMVFMSLTLLVGMMGGGGVEASDKFSFVKLSAMSNEELTKIPNDFLKKVLDDLAKLSVNEIKEIDRQQVERICQQWLDNSERATLDSIIDISQPMTKSLGSLNIGVNEVISSADYGWYTTGGAQSLARYNVPAKRQEAVTQISLGGSCYGTAYTTFSFYVEGEASGVANIGVSSYIAATALAGGAGYGNSQVKFELVVEKLTGASYEKREIIKEISDNSAIYDYVSASTHYLFEPDNWYRIAMVIHTSAWWFGLGGAVADAYDSSSHYSEWYAVNIDWW